MSTQTIQIRRGSQSTLDGITLTLGELGYCTDTKRLYIGNGIGNTLLSTSWSLDVDTGELTYNGGNVTSSVAPTAADHLTNKEYVDSVSGFVHHTIPTDVSVIVSEGEQHVVINDDFIMDTGGSFELGINAQLLYLDDDFHDGGSFA